MTSKTFENISFRKGYDKGQSTMMMKWFPKTKLTIEKGKMLYSTFQRQQNLYIFSLLSRIFRQIHLNLLISAVRLCF